jgi:hypothetical protein
VTRLRGTPARTELGERGGAVAADLKALATAHDDALRAVRAAYVHDALRVVPTLTTSSERLRQRGKESWHVRLCVNGAYVTFTAKGTRLDAENLANERYAAETEDAQRLSQGLKVGVRFSDLLSDYRQNVLPELTAGAQKSYLGSFAAFTKFFIEELDDPKIIEIRRAHIRRYFTWRRTHRTGSPRVARRSLLLLPFVALR